MCLCKHIVFTFSNENAFERLDHKLRELSDEFEKRCYPKGTLYVIISHKKYTPKKRDELPYEMLVVLAKLRDITTTHIHFWGWADYQKVRQRVMTRDVFGKVTLEVAC